MASDSNTPVVLPPPLPPPSSPPAYEHAVSSSRITDVEQRLAKLESAQSQAAMILSRINEQVQGNAALLTDLRSLLANAAESNKEQDRTVATPATNKTPLVLSAATQPPLPAERRLGNALFAAEETEADTLEEEEEDETHSVQGDLGEFFTPATRKPLAPQSSLRDVPSSSVKLDRLIQGMGLSASEEEDRRPRRTQQAIADATSPFMRSSQGQIPPPPRTQMQHLDLTKLINKPTEFRGGTKASPLGTVQWVRSMDQFLALRTDLTGETRAMLASTYLKDKAEAWFHAWFQSRVSRGNTTPVVWPELAKALLKKHKCHLLEERSRQELSRMAPCKRDDHVDRFLKEFDTLRLNCFSMPDSVLMQKLYDLTIGIPHIYEKTQVEFDSYQSIDEMLDRLYDLDEVHFQAYGRGRKGDYTPSGTSTVKDHLNALSNMDLSKKEKDQLRKLTGGAKGGNQKKFGNSKDGSVNGLELCFGCGKSGHRADSADCPNSAQRDAQDQDYLAARQARFEAWRSSKARGARATN